MDQVQQELTFEESVKQVMQTLPPVIRDYLAQGRYTPVAKSLMTKYTLRIDQGGVLEREIMLLLMGIENPEEFTKALIEEAKLNQQTVSGIVQEVNTQIFIPLREEMARGAQLAKPAASAPQTQTPPRFFHLENKLAARGTAIPPRPLAPTPAGVGAPTESVGATKVAPVAPQPKPTQPSPLATVIGNVLSAQPKVAPQPPRPSSNIAPLPPKFVLPRAGAVPIFGGPKLLEDHEEPHIELAKAPMQPRPAPEVRPSEPQMQTIISKTEAQAPLRPVVAPSVVGPNLPGAMPPVSVPVVPSRPAASMPITPPKSYSVDPYREPIE